ncbi:MAG: HIT family protein [Nanoarchaeota archaeon]
MDYEEVLIKEYGHWKVYLHENQGYLGRVYIWAKRKDAFDFFDMTREEQEEYFKIGREIKKALKKLFEPDIYNYATLANVTRHLHTHIIPRYEDKREIFGITFIDERWSKNYAPQNNNFEVSEEVLIKIKDLIKSEL